MKEDGLIDTTVSNIFIPDLGGANSVARPFAIGVNTESVFCKGNDHVKGSYPIRNLVFKNINIQPNPGCSSVLYDNTGQVVWGDDGSGTPSMAFYNAEESDQANCDFHEVVQFSANPAYYVCGETDEVDAAKHCMAEDGVVGSEPNIDYSSVLGVPMLMSIFHTVICVAGLTKLKRKWLWHDERVCACAQDVFVFVLYPTDLSTNKEGLKG